MTVKIVKVPGVSEEALVVAHKLVIAMRNANTTGTKAVYLNGSLVLARRTAASELVLPITPKLKTYNQLTLPFTLQPINSAQEIQTHSFNDIGGIRKVEIFSATEVQDIENTDTAFIREADDPELFRVIGTNNYNSYENPQNNGFFQALIEELLLLVFTDNEITLGAFQFLELTSFYAKQSDPAYTLFDWIVSQIPDELAVEEVMHALLARVQYYTPKTNRGLFLGSSHFDDHFAFYSTFLVPWIRYDSKGELIAACHFQDRIREYFDVFPKTDFLDIYADEDVVTYNFFAEDRKYFFTITAKELFRHKTRPVNSTLTKGALSANALEPVSGEAVYWGVTYSASFSATGDNPLIFPSSQHAEHLDLIIPWVGNAVDYHATYGDGVFEWDYTFLGGGAIDLTLVYPHMLFPLDTVPQHDDFVSDSIAIVPLRIDIIKDEETGTYSGTYHYAIVIDAFNGGYPENISTEAQHNASLLGVHMLIYPTIIESYYLNQLNESGPYGIAMEYLSSRFLRDTWEIRSAGNETETSGSSLTFAGADSVTRDAVYGFYFGRQQINREYSFGAVLTEIVLHSNSYSFTEPTGDRPLHLLRAKTTLTMTRNTLFSYHRTLDFDGDKFVITTPSPSYITTLANTGASVNATHVLGYNPQQTSIWNVSPTNQHTITMPAYTVTWRPKPEDSPRTLYSVNQTVYRYGKTVTPKDNFSTYFYDTPSRVFNDGDINAQNFPLPLDQDPTSILQQYPNVVNPRLRLNIIDRVLDATDTSVRFDGVEIAPVPDSLSLPFNTRRSFHVSNSQDFTSDDLWRWMVEADYVQTGSEQHHDTLWTNGDDEGQTMKYSATYPSFFIQYKGTLFPYITIADKLPTYFDTLVYSTIWMGLDRPNNSKPDWDSGSRTLHIGTKWALGTRATNTEFLFEWYGFSRSLLEASGLTVIATDEKPIYPQRAFTFIETSIKQASASITPYKMIDAGNGWNPEGLLVKVQAMVVDNQAQYALFQPFVHYEGNLSKVAIRGSYTPNEPHYALVYNEWINAQFIVDATGTSKNLFPPAGADTFERTTIWQDNILFNREDKK